MPSPASSAKAVRKRARAGHGSRGCVAFVAAAVVALTAPALRAAEQAHPTSDAYLYVRAGYGAVHARGMLGGPAVGIGWRYLPEHVGIELTAFNFVFTSRDHAFDSVTGSFFRAAARYEMSPRARGTPFASVGLGWGVAGATVGGVAYRGSGVDVGIALGYVGRLPRGVRWLAQVDATLPTYHAVGSVFEPVGTSIVVRRDTFYAPSLVLSLGLGLDGSREAEP